MPEKMPGFTPEEQKRYSERGGNVSGQSRRGEIKRGESGEWELTQKGQEDLREEALKEDFQREYEKKHDAKIEKLFNELKEQDFIQKDTKEEQKPPAETKELKIDPSLEYLAKKAEEINNKKTLAKEIFEKQSEVVRRRFGIGFGTIGFLIEEQKNKFFAGLYGVAGKGFKEKGTLQRFFSSLREVFDRDAKRARKNIEEVKEGKSKKLAHAGYLAGNLIKYGRTVADFVGWTAASPFRYVMLSAMGFARGAEAAKEARFKNEEVIEKTRIEDINDAEKEAWDVYEKALAESGGEKPRKETLEKAYSENLPTNILERLRKDPQPGVVSGIMQRIAKRYVLASAERIQSHFNAIDANEKLSEAEKKKKKDRWLNLYSRHLKDMDRMIEKYGTVDALAFGAKTVELGAKTAVAALMAESLYLAGKNLWEKGMPAIMGWLENPPKFPESVKVEKGDSVWKIIERQLATRYGEKFSGLDESKKTYIIDALKDKIVADPSKFGLENPDNLKVGQKIKIGELLGTEKDTGAIFEKAGALGASDLENIKKNNMILREWVRTHPGESLTSEKVNEILSRGGLIAETPPQRPFGHLPAEEQLEKGYRKEFVPFVSREVLEDISRNFNPEKWVGVSKILNTPEIGNMKVDEFLTNVDSPKPPEVGKFYFGSPGSKDLAGYIREHAYEPYGMLKMKEALEHIRVSGPHIPAAIGD